MYLRQQTPTGHLLSPHWILPTIRMATSLTAATCWSTVCTISRPIVSSVSELLTRIVVMQDDLLREVNTIFMRFLFHHSFPLERWSKSVHCILQKKQHLYIYKLRIIQLFEADFSSALKYVLGRILLYHSEEQGINSTQTHGSRLNISTHGALTINSHMISAAWTESQW